MIRRRRGKEGNPELEVEKMNVRERTLKRMKIQRSRLRMWRRLRIKTRWMRIRRWLTRRIWGLRL